MTKPEYNDDYSSCEETYATLRIFDNHLSPDSVSARLEIEPTRTLTKGEARGKQGRVNQSNGWFLSSEHHVVSLDTRRHIDWILDQLSSNSLEILQMQKNGAKIDITSFWVSKSGNGGPMLSTYQLQRLSEMQIEICWDIYIGEQDV